MAVYNGPKANWNLKSCDVRTQMEKKQMIVWWFEIVIVIQSKRLFIESVINAKSSREKETDEVSCGELCRQFKQIKMNLGWTQLKRVKCDCKMQRPFVFSVKELETNRKLGADKRERERGRGISYPIEYSEWLQSDERERCGETKKRIS